MEQNRGVALGMISMVYPYYNNFDMLKFQFSVWKNYSDDLLDSILFVIIDDGSSIKPKIEPGFNLLLATIKEDLYWNLTGAKNLGMHVARDKCVLTDIDHVVPEETVKFCLNYNLALNEVKFFKRKGRGIHTGTFFINKQTFWDCGGYDEDFSGNYSNGDSDLLERLKLNNRVDVLDQQIIAYDKDDSIKDATCGPRHKKNLDYIRKEIALNDQKRKSKLPNRIVTNHLRFTWDVQSWSRK